MGSIRSAVYRVIDAVVAKVAYAPFPIRCALGFVMHPLMLWRIQEWARTLATYPKLPPIHWNHVEKHGQNVVYQSQVVDKGEKVIQGLWVVDYSKRTRRIVFGLPEAYARVGKTF